MYLGIPKIICKYLQVFCQSSVNFSPVTHRYIAAKTTPNNIQTRNLREHCNLGFSQVLSLCLFLITIVLDLSQLLTLHNTMRHSLQDFKCAISDLMCVIH